jgi:coenzyme PQQ precursor peptide PqqA
LPAFPRDCENNFAAAAKLSFSPVALPALGDPRDRDLERRRQPLHRRIEPLPALRFKIRKIALPDAIFAVIARQTQRKVTAAAKAASVLSAGHARLETRLKENPMSWTAPVVVEICAGMEVTAYLTAEM